MCYALVEVTTPAEWASMHDIRRSVLFAPPRRSTDYDEAHPDDRTPCNHPYLLLHKGRPVAVTRLDDRRDGTAIVRLVAVAEGEQRRGHGRALAALVEAKARQLGAAILYVNAAPDAVGFYGRCGWRETVWDPSELNGIAADCVQMMKVL